MTTSINTIPASAIVKVVPSVINAGGAALDLIGLMLSTANMVPMGTVLSFPTSTSVSSYFGATSVEAINAASYFSGFSGEATTPAALLIANYPLANVGAYLRGANISTLPLASLQALTGTLVVTIDGVVKTSSNINLSSATSFSSAANLITTALNTTGPTQAVVTGSMGGVFVGTASGTNLTIASVTSGTLHPGDTITGTGISGTVTIVSQTSGTTGLAGVYVTSASTTASSATITATSTTLVVSAVSSGTLAVGQQVTGSGVTSGTFITALGTGLGGVGTYIVTNAQTVASETLTMIQPTVTYSSLTGAFTVVSGTTGASSTISAGSGSIASGLGLTTASGAVTSQGAAATDPVTFMNGITAYTQNWATFFHAFDPDAGSGNAQKLLFASWVNAPSNGQNNRYMYIVEDSDITPTLSSAATGSLGYKLLQSASSGTMVIYQPSAMHLAAFASGVAASIDFTQHNGRTTFAFRTQPGLPISVTNGNIAANLIANGYNFTGLYATANQLFQFFQTGTVSGQFQWADSYINQIWLNAQLQLALMEVLQNNKSIPYNPSGYGLLRAACLDPITKAVDFGAIRTGVTLSDVQIQEIDGQAGIAIEQFLQTQGWYLQIRDAVPQVRQARGSPPMTLWYVDGQSVQSIVLASILIQ